MPNCSINGCKTSSSNAKERKLKLFSFPKSFGTRLKWIAACKKPYKFNENNARICSKHFPEDAFEKPLIQKMLNYSPTNSRKLKLDAVPTKFLPPFAETEVKIDMLCNEIENIPMDEVEIIDETDPLEPVSANTSVADTTAADTTTIDDPKDTQSLLESVVQITPVTNPVSNEEKNMSREVRVAHETLLATYQKFFAENEELKLKNKALKSDCDKHKKLYEKRLQENIKLRQRNRALFNETVKLRNRLKKYEQPIKFESITVCTDDIVDIEQGSKSVASKKKTAKK